MFFSVVGLLVIIVTVSAGLLGSFKSKTASNSINNTNSENKSANGKINRAKNYEVVVKNIKVEKIKENTQGQKKERHKNIKRSIEGQEEKKDFECKINADKKFKEFVGNLSNDHNDIKYLRCRFVSIFNFAVVAIF